MMFKCPCGANIRDAVLMGVYDGKCPLCEKPWKDMDVMSKEEYDKFQAENGEFKMPTRLTPEQWKKTRCKVCGCEADIRLFELDKKTGGVQELYFCEEHGSEYTKSKLEGAKKDEQPANAEV